MPGLGLGAGLNRRQQNRFNAAAQGGQGQQWLAAHPGIQQRTAGNQAVQNFANTGQVGANAAPRFQPGGGQSPQGSGATGSQKGPGGGGGGGGQPQAPMQSMNQAQTVQNMGPGQGGFQQTGQQGGYNPPWGQPGSPQWNNYLQAQDQQQKAWMAAHPGAGNPFAGMPQGAQSLGQIGNTMQGMQGGGVWGAGQGPQMGQLGSQLANQGAGAANQGGLGQQQRAINPQAMQALLQALQGVMQR